MTKRHLTIATRESPLALQQAEIVKMLLLAHHPHLTIEFLGITTQADKLGTSLATIGGKGLFVKELEEALLDSRADIAVHSMKDMPMDLPDGLSIPVITAREDPRDVFISDRYASLAELPIGASIGTSSLRRQTQLHALRSDLSFHPVRGNIQTRLKKLAEENFTALVLAAAGLKRMQLTRQIQAYFSIEEILPAAGQGALGIECRADDLSVLSLLEPLNNWPTHRCVAAERAMCRRLGGGCQVPVAAYAQIKQNVLTLRGLVANRSGTRILRVKQGGRVESAEEIGERVAAELIQQGALTILREFS